MKIQVVAWVMTPRSDVVG